jgi:probable phosphoglycerate mutase
MTRFIVVRHGYSTTNKSKIFASHTDAPLTEQGKKQAECVAAYLAQAEKVDHIYCSGLTRTRQTAMPSAARFGLPVQVEKGLIEIFAGLWENLSYKEINTRYHEDWMIWLHDISHARPTGGESMREHYLRVERTVHRLAAEHEGQTLLLFTHYTPVRVMNAMAAGLSPEQIGSAKLPLNASVNVYRYENGKLFAEEQNRITYPLSLSVSKRFPPPPQMPRTEE